MKRADGLDKTIVGGLLLTLLLPFVIGPFDFFPYITGRNIAFRLITEIVFTLYLLRLLTEGRSKRRRSPVSIALFAFVFVLLVTAATGVNPARSLFSNFERMEGLVTFLHLLAWFVAAAGTFRDRKQWELFLKANLVVAAVISIWCLLEAAHFLPAIGERLAGPFGNPIYLSYYAYFTLFWAAFFLIRRKRIDWPAVACGALLAIQLFILVKTATRGAMLAFLFGAALALFLLVRSGHQKRRWRRLALVFALPAILGVVAFLGLRAGTPVGDGSLPGRFAAISITNLSQDLDRVAIWKIAWQGIRERPLLGWGLENFDAVFDRHYDPRLAGRTQWFDRAHNTYLEWWLVGGIFGLLAYLAIFAVAFHMIARAPLDSLSRPEKSVLAGLLAGYLLLNFFDFDNLISYLSFFSLLAFLHGADPRAKDRTLEPRRSESAAVTAIRRAGMGAVIVGGAALVAFVNWRPAYSLLMLNHAYTSQPAGYEKNLEYFERSLAHETCGRAEICRRLCDAAVKLDSEDQGKVPAATREKYVAAAFRHMERLTAEKPSNARNEVAFGNFLSRVDRPDEAIRHLQRAHEISPRKPTILMELALAFLARGRHGEALIAARRAFELNPDFEEARKIYALTAVLGGRIDLTRSLLMPVYGTMAVDEDRFIMVYSLAGKWPYVIEILSGRLEKNPGDLQARVGLARALMQNGEKEKAIDHIEIAIHLDPSFREEGMRMIQEISAGKLQ